MSTDTDDEYAGNLIPAAAAAVGAAATGNQAEMSSSTTTVFITANVGSMFEDAGTLVPKWHEQVLSFLAANSPQFVAIHFQEVRSKNVFARMKIGSAVEIFYLGCEQNIPFLSAKLVSA
jgi:hypothetical protein